MEDVCNVDTVRFVRVLEQCFQHREKVYSKVGLSLRREDLCSELHMTTKGAYLREPTGIRQYMPLELKWERFPAPVYFVGGGMYTDDGEDDGESSIDDSGDEDNVSKKGGTTCDNESSEEEMFIETGPYEKSIWNEVFLYLTTGHLAAHRVVSKNRKLNFVNHRVKQYAVIKEEGESQLYFSKNGKVPCVLKNSRTVLC